MGSDRPLQGPRRRLLLAALENSRWLLAGGHDDPKVRAELTTLVARVEGLLAEQDLRWEADGAFQLRDPQVRAELRLTPEQARRVDRALPPPKGPPDKGPPRPPDPPVEVKIELIKSLTPEQRQRFRQIWIQLRVPMVFNEPEVIDPLNLSYPQRRQIKTILHEELWGGFGPPPKGPRPPPDRDARARAVEHILELLTPQQRESWNALVGKPFNPNR